MPQVPPRYPRDMIGYGATPPNPKWPKGAKIAVQIVVNYEEGGENNILHGDAASEAVLEAAAIAPGELVDETFADFNVEFAGRVWDHKTIVYALVFGQWVRPRPLPA